MVLSSFIAIKMFASMITELAIWSLAYVLPIPEAYFSCLYQKYTMVGIFLLLPDKYVDSGKWREHKKKLSGTDPNWFNHIFIAFALCLKTRNKQNNSHLHLGIKICFDEIRGYFENKTLCLFAMSVQTKRLLIAFRHWHWHYKTKILTYIQIQDRHRNRPMSIRCAIDVVSYYESNHMSRVDHHGKHVLWNLQLQPQPLHAQMPFRVSL